MGVPEELSETSFESADGSFLMSAWGGAFDQRPAEVISAQWELARRKGDRDINYQRRGSTWFVVSGTDREGIEYYEKFTMRGQHAAFLSIQFSRSRLRQFEQWVEEIEDGFGVISLRGGAPAIAPQLRVDRPGGERNANPPGGKKRADTAGSTELRKKTPSEEPAVRVPTREPARPRQADGSNDMSNSTRPGRPGSPDVPDPPAVKDPPVALKVEGKTGFVYSPFHPDRRLVDVVGIPSGKKMKCPYTLKIFRVP